MKSPDDAQIGTKGHFLIAEVRQEKKIPQILSLGRQPLSSLLADV